MIKYILLQLLVIAIVVILIYYLSKKSKSEAIYVKSSADNKEYLVQNLENKEEAAYVLGIIKKRINILKEYLQKNINKYPEYKSYIEQFCKRINGIVLYENPPDGKYTSFTVNKGDEIALCLRSKNGYNLHDLNLIMYVVIHELAHVACPEVDHTELFKKIFIFLLTISIDINIYKKQDYEAYPVEYCGLIINENLLG
ncbi:putative metallopeptidase WLM domain protein [Moumouvirus australiensis]|uniref:Putative metallopeptidase WLM domain protein n=1 Tax=Moumouvirus australiensis TaxID=2109587 RepID=A0A2P1ELY1_9VIRU|nr:putative metallopeptidase WLM domain protein [Moumouvirus australiensis]AVL94889.1 putative metallopeptidase WLM domain protein [Moumouvirus australiensis]